LVNGGQNGPPIENAPKTQKNIMIDLNRSRNLARLLPALIVSLNLILTGRTPAQTFTTLHGFTNVSTNSFGAYTNSDGTVPIAGLILSGNTLYGTADSGGSSGLGTVFKVNKDGTGFTNLYSFSAASFDDDGNYTNSDGRNPEAGLILSGNTLYGTASSGGIGGNGTVFAVNTNGTGFTNLHSFTALDSATQSTNSDGANPFAGLILSGSTLYGTANNGGSSGSGTVFAVNTNGSGFTVLHSFTTSVRPYYTNSDGAKPAGGLILSGSMLYGTAYNGGSSGSGTVFALNTNGSGFTVLFGFTNFLVTGDAPQAGLILSGNTLYGTTEDGGSSGSGGTVFALNTNGSGFKVLYNFTYSEGDRPEAGLVLSGNTLYGTTPEGGTNDSGTVFALNTDGSAFTTLHRFTGDTNGASPEAGLILSGNTLYGTAPNAGANFGSGVYGTLFSLTLPSPPPLAIVHAGENVLLTWPTNAAGLTFTLQFTTNLVSPAGWNTVSPASAVVSGQNTVTNPISGTQTFFRLSQ
jgi:uncharacterized repeat protein (TIGR03803 family)